MLENALLKNFQAHKETFIEFSKGVNCLVGSSDNGKSSIIRGILWAYSNRPLGDSFVSYWNRDKKDAIKGETSVSLSFSEGEMKRVKTPDTNGYLVGDKEFGAIGTDIPQEASALFNITDLNISSQHDKPFLLSESAGDVAKYLNSLVKLDKIDKVLQTIESMKRETKKEMDRAKADTNDIKADLEAYIWLPRAKELYTTISFCESEIKEIVEKEKTLSALRESAMLAKESLDRANQTADSLKKASRVAKEIEALSEDIKAREQKEDICGLERAIKSIRDCEKDLQKAIVVDESLIKKIEELIMQIKESDEKITSLSQIVEIAKRTGASIEELERKIKEYIDTLPEMCPSCGRPMEDDKC